MQNRQPEPHINQPRFKSVFFDLDGTLTDPCEGITNSYLHAVEKLGLHEAEPEIIKSFIGSSLHLYFVEWLKLSGKAVEDGVKFYREYFSKKGLYENRIFDGIPELLLELFNNEVRLFVVTSKPTVYAKEILIHFGLDNYFANIYGSGFTVQNSSKDVLIADCLNGERLGAEYSLMVGDRKHDIIGAKTNRVKSAAVTYGYGSIEELKNCDPDYTANTVEELYDIILG